MENVKSKLNPWKGLQSYQESDTIYGRDKEIDSLYMCVTYNTQTVVYGKSGIGKSSIINAGVMHRARLNNFLPVTIRLVHSSEKSDVSNDSYLFQIRRCIEETASSLGIETEEVVSHDASHEETLWEFFHRFRYWKIDDDKRYRIIPILVFDQFEEIFTLEHNIMRVRQFFDELANLLNDVVPDYLRPKSHDIQPKDEGQNGGRQFLSSKNIFSNMANRKRASWPDYLQGSDFHLVITLREDFLSYLERYTAFIPSMRDNRFPILPLTVEQAADVIMMPRPGLVSKDVAEQILQTITGNPEVRINGLNQAYVDAAVLSLYLSRLYDKMESGDNVISSEMVKTLSNHIIQDFYQESVSDIDDGVIQIIEDALLTNDGRRDNVSRLELVERGVDESIIDNLVYDRKLLRQFTYAGVLRIEFMHDILCNVVKERVNFREQERLHKEREQEQQRIAEENELKLIEARQRAQILQRRNHRLLFTGVVALLSLLVIGFVLWDGLIREVDARYGSVVKRGGWYEGLEKLSSDDASYRDSHFVLKYKGRWAKHPYAMEARDGYDHPTSHHDIITYIADPKDNTDDGLDSLMRKKMQSICKWEFVTNKEGDFVVQEKSLNENDDLIFVFNQSKTNVENQVIGTYSDDQGFPILIRDSAYFYVKNTYNADGYEVKSEFFDDEGMSITNKDGAYKTVYNYLSDGLKCSELSAFLDGNLMNDRQGHCGYVCTKFTEDSLRHTEVICVDQMMKPIASTSDSVSVVRYSYDEHGRRTKVSFWDCQMLKYDINGELYAVGLADAPDTIIYSSTTNNGGAHEINYEYNRHGQIVREFYKDLKGKPCAIKCVDYGMLFEKRYEYDEWGNLTDMLVRYDKTNEGKTCRYHDGNVMILNDEWSLTKNRLKEQNDTIYKSRYFIDLDNGREYTQNDAFCKIVTYDNHGNVVETRFMDLDMEKSIEHDGYHISKIKYQYENKETMFTESLYNQKGLLVNGKDGWAYMTVKVDSISKTKSFIFFDKDHKYIEGFRNIFDDDAFSHKISEESIDSEWRTIRKYENGAFYYKMHVLHPQKPSISDSIIGWYAVNEFDEPSLVTDAYGVYYARYSPHGKVTYFDEQRKNLSDPSNYTSFQLAYIEIQDDKGKLGFKDADIILSCNDWDYYPDSDDPFINTGWWDNVNREFLVARLDSATRQFRLVKIVVSDKVTDIDKYVKFIMFNASYYEAKSIIESVQKEAVEEI